MSSLRGKECDQTFDSVGSRPLGEFLSKNNDEAKVLAF
jgi:hypothetical protein